MQKKIYGNERAIYQWVRDTVGDGCRGKSSGPIHAQVEQGLLTGTVFSGLAQPGTSGAVVYNPGPSSPWCTFEMHQTFGCRRRRLPSLVL